MADWTFLAYDLRSNRPVDELPLSSPEFTAELSGMGSWQASVKLSARNRDRMRAAIRPGRTAVYAMRGDVIVADGILWDAEYSSEGEALQLSGQGLGSYLYHRAIDFDVDETTDALAAPRRLIQLMQAQAGSDLGFVVEGRDSSGFEVDLVYYDYELRRYWDALAALAAPEYDEGGFEFLFRARWDSGGHPTRLLQLGWPRLGRTADAGGHTPTMFEFPGNIATYPWPEAGGDLANTVFVSGAGDGAAADTARAQDSEAISLRGDARLDWVLDAKDVDNPDRLAALARAELAARREPPEAPSFDVLGDAEPEIGTYLPGDDCRIRVDDSRRTGVDATYRILSTTIKPGDSGPERVSVTCELLRA